MEMLVSFSQGQPNWWSFDVQNCYRSWWLHEREALQWGIEQDHHQERFQWTKSREQLSLRCWSIHTIRQSTKPRTGRLKWACDGQCTVRSWCTDLFQCSLLWTSQAKLRWNSAANNINYSETESTLVMKVLRRICLSYLFEKTSTESSSDFELAFDSVFEYRLLIFWMFGSNSRNFLKTHKQIRELWLNLANHKLSLPLPHLCYGHLRVEQLSSLTGKKSHLCFCLRH